MTGWRTALVITGLFLIGGGFFLRTLEPGAVLAFLLPEPVEPGTGTHIYLVGPLAAIPVLIRFLAGIPWFIWCAAGVFLFIAGLAVAARHRHRIVPATGAQVPRWKDPRTRLLDSMRRELRRFR